MNRIPLPLATLWERMQLPPEGVLAVEAVRRASAWREMVEDYRPLARSLEWKLADVDWLQAGVLPFVEDQVPYLVNNNGRISADAAALLLANCRETSSSGERITVLELGAGLGLFARYFLDEFRLLCERESEDYYERLAYYVTDRSPRTIEQWREREVFQGHEDHVFPLVADAASPLKQGPFRAVICNYLLGVLPGAIVRRREQGWEELWVRTWMGDDRKLLRQYTTLDFDQIRAMAASTSGEDRARLLPLVPLLEFEREFRPVTPDEPPGLDTLGDVPENVPFAYNYGACECLDALLPRLQPGGFVLVNDYGAARDEEQADPAGSQRFGRSTAVGLNFPLLARWLERRGIEVLEPAGDDARPHHARLLTRSVPPATRAAFEKHFSAAEREKAEAPAAEARRLAEMGRAREALESFRAAIEQNPREWQLIGEAAVFAATQLRDPAAALELARAALELNPWYSAWLWNVLGDCLSALERSAEAHESYLQAERIHPRDVNTNLKLAASWLTLGEPGRSLEAVARGLANDSEGMFRHLLLEKQQKALGALSVRWNAERAMAARR